MNLITYIMKKAILFLWVFFMLFTVISCNRNAVAINELRSLCDEIEENFEEYTDSDFERITIRFKEIEKGMENLELTDAERKEYSELQGRYYGIFTKAALKSAKDEIKRISEDVEGAVKGFVDAVKE